MQVYVSKLLGYQEFSRCPTRGESEEAIAPGNAAGNQLKPRQMSPEAQNWGISSPTKSNKNALQ